MRKSEREARAQIASNVAVAAEVRILTSFELDEVGSKQIWSATDSKFSLAESVVSLWHAKSYLLAILIATLSGAWPYAELCLLAFSVSTQPGYRVRIWLFGVWGAG